MFALFIRREGRDLWLVWQRTEMHTGFWMGRLKLKDLLEDLGINGKIILKMDLKKIEWKGVS